MSAVSAVSPGQGKHMQLADCIAVLCNTARSFFLAAVILACAIVTNASVTRLSAAVSATLQT